MTTTKILDKSIIVAAHPDDEVLWFSSILDKVDEIVICYLGISSKPKWYIGRQKSLLEYPLKKIVCLGLEEAVAYYNVDWQDPLITKFGLKINDKHVSSKIYEENYYKLKQHLENKLAGYFNVFTHSPWGEYGHDEHVQVYRVIKELQKEMNFNLWFSNYCSNKSIKLMSDYMYKSNLEYLSLTTNKGLAAEIKDLYKKNSCWTWYDNWQWFDEESFIKDDVSKQNNTNYGLILPLNFIKVWYEIESKNKRNTFWSRISRIPSKLIKK